MTPPRPGWRSVEPAWRLARQRARRFGARLVPLLLQPVAGVLLMHGAVPGLLLWAALGTEPRLAAAGFGGIMVGEALRHLMRSDGATGFAGSVKANAFLAAIAMAWLTRHAGLPILADAVLVAMGGGMAAVMATAIKGALEPTPLPALAWAYCLVVPMFFAFFPEWALRSVVAMPWGPPPAAPFDWIVALLRGLGAIVFVPTPLAGMLVAAALLWWSRLGFLLGLVGWAAGVLTAQGFLGLGETYYWLPASYNFLIAGMALGAVQFLPSRASIVIAACAGAFASVVALALQVALEGSPTAYLPIASGITVWIGIGALRVARGDLIHRNREPMLPPEEAWRRDAFTAARWGRGETLLAVPVGGLVEVTQGFAGRLSHAGAWRHALDFQRPGAPGGGRPSIAGTPVFAPAPGVVEAVRAEVADNLPGHANFAENWGNHVILRLDQGHWAMVAHLRQGSIAAVPGQRVDYGSVVGLVGSSGRAPAPHLHLQAQQGPAAGAPTRPFRLLNFIACAGDGDGGPIWHAAGVPGEGSILSVALPEPTVHGLLTGIVPGRSVWSVEATGPLPQAFRPRDRASATLDARFAPDGLLVLADLAGGSLEIRFEADAWRITDARPGRSPLLTLLALAVPSVPYAAQPGMGWDDVAPVVPDRGLFCRRLSAVTEAPFTPVRSHCLAIPSPDDEALGIETQALHGTWAASRLAARFEPLRGVCRLDVACGEGRATWSMVSFVPELPLVTA